MRWAIAVVLLLDPSTSLRMTLEEDSATLDEDSTLDDDSATSDEDDSGSTVPSTVNVTYSDIQVSPELSVTTATAECIPGARPSAFTW